MKLTPKKFHYVMIGVNVLLAILIMVVAYFGYTLINKQTAKLTSAKAQAKIASDQQISLITAKKDLQNYSELNKIAQSIVPQDKDQAKTIREINKIASEKGIVIKSISFDTSNLGQKSPTPSSGTSSTSATSATTKAPPISQLQKVEGMTNVYALPINIATDESNPIAYESLIQFLEKLENNRRTAHVTNISIKPDKKSDKLSFSLKLNAYVKP